MQKLFHRDAQNLKKRLCLVQINWSKLSKTFLEKKINTAADRYFSTRPVVFFFFY